MLLRHREWEQITLLRHVTQSLDQINDEDIKKNILWEEINWLNQYWAQPPPKSRIAEKYWQRLFRHSKTSTIHIDDESCFIL
ncbi:unnamed protein product [Rotaria sordida]|uniref:Uncharacterized protein n=1 Tax=Rotaria sordida TaxID=392033 RepID=A0A815AUN3_9BILA|nr:unnamed protein product [Rotaria sordida]CAF1262175.1 unnamed protein product [Rotaria sordida]